MLLLVSFYLPGILVFVNISQFFCFDDDNPVQKSRVRQKRILGINVNNIFSAIDTQGKYACVFSRAKFIYHGSMAQPYTQTEPHSMGRVLALIIMEKNEPEQTLALNVTMDK
jgi:hypothetical protein